MVGHNWLLVNRSSTEDIWVRPHSADCQHEVRLNNLKIPTERKGHGQVQQVCPAGVCTHELIMSMQSKLLMFGNKRRHTVTSSGRLNPPWGEMPQTDLRTESVSTVDSLCRTATLTPNIQ